MVAFAMPILPGKEAIDRQTIGESQQRARVASLHASHAVSAASLSIVPSHHKRQDRPLSMPGRQPELQAGSPRTQPC